VPVGQKLNIEVRRDGFRTQTMVVDGVQAKVKVKLVGSPPASHGGGKPAGGGKPPAPDPGKPAPPAPPSIGGGEIVNPWAK